MDWGKPANGMKTYISEIKDILDKYEDGDEKVSTIADVADEIEFILSERGGEDKWSAESMKLDDAVFKFRSEQDENDYLSGRGDMDSAEEEFKGAIKEFLQSVSG